jgi:hypothetical protein
VPYLEKIRSRFSVNVVNGEMCGSENFLTDSGPADLNVGHDTTKRRVIRRTASNEHVPDLSQLQIGRLLADPLVKEGHKIYVA